MQYRIENIEIHDDAGMHMHEYVRGLSIIASEMVLTKKDRHIENTRDNKAKISLYNWGTKISFKVTEKKTGHWIAGDMYPYEINRHGVNVR